MTVLLSALLLAAVAGNSGGAVLYATHCASCHGSTAQGSAVAPPLLGKSAVDVHFMLDTGRMPAADPYVNEIHRAPAFTQPQMTQLVDYVLSFSRHSDRAMPLLGPGDVRSGRALFAANCAVCHGAGGNGSSVGFSNVAPSLMHATSYQVAEAIRAGPEVMPRFGPDVLSDRDVDGIVRYVNLLQTQADRPNGEDSGGIGLGHVGPVAEGFVAWLFGIGALVLLCRKIGSTR